MLQKIQEAIGILTANIVLLSLLVLTVSLPESILIEYVNFKSPLPDDSYQQIAREIRISNWVQFGFGPIYIGGIIYSLSQLKQGISTTYSQAISAGLRSWGKLLAANLLSSLVIFLGLLGLVIPGIIFAVRYSLVGSVAVLEGTNASQSLKRSAQLTKGKRWEIFGAILLFIIVAFPGMIIISIILYIPVEFAGQSSLPVINILWNCVASIILTIVHIVLFLYYWELRHEGLGD